MMEENSCFKILLISPTDLQMNDSEMGRLKPYLPKLNLAIIYEWLKRQFNDSVNINVIEQAAYGFNFKELRNIISRMKPDIVCITSMTFNIMGAYRIAEIVKSLCSQTITIIGGPHVTALPELTLKESANIDIAVIGEGEITLLELINHLKSGMNKYDLHEIKGIAYRSEDGIIFKTVSRPLIEDINIVPYPKYEAYDLSKFSLEFCPLTMKTQKWFSILASRGCTYNCTFCMQTMGRRFRSRDPKIITEEIQYLRSNYFPEIIYFEDSCMTINRKWFTELCDCLIESGISSEIEWGFQTRVDKIDEDLLCKAVKAGCIYVNYGVESGSDSILEKNYKAFTVEKMLKTIEITRRCGIRVIHGSFILGLPYETRVSIEQTLRLIEKIDLDMVAVSIMDVYPGTAVFDMIEHCEGGLQWLPRMRYNWHNYRRDSPQFEVNDLTACLLKNYYAAALDIIEKKTGLRYCI